MTSAADIAAAGVILRRPTGRGDRFLLLRATKHGEWGFPKGHQDPGEDLLTTARRECREECGIADAVIDPVSFELFYRLPDSRLKRVVYYGGSTETVAVTISDEHDEATWCTANQVRELLPHEGLVRLFDRHLALLARSRTATC
jgi:8-oxo-dGTP pyrophosphatase MutT (NUDIX family)